MKRGLRRLLVVTELALIIDCYPAFAGIPMVPCDRIVIVPGAAVNTVIFPFKVETSARAVTAASDELSYLIYLTALFSMAKFESIAVVRLVVPPGGRVEECEATHLLPRFIDKVKPGRALIVFWGRLYEEDGEVYVRNYLRFLRKDETEGMRVQINEKTFSGRPASQAFAFSPQNLTAKLLSEIDAEFQRAVVLRNEPSERSLGTRLSFGARYYSNSYSVSEMKDDWIKLVGHSEGSNSGWVRANIRVGPSRLAEMLPELNFIEGLTGYLRIVERSTNVAPAGRAKWYSWTNSAFGRFDVAEEEDALLARGVGKQLLGISQMKMGLPGSALRFFNDANQLIPYSSDARNLVLLAELKDAVSKKIGLRSRAMAAEFAQSVALDPDNIESRQNLRSFYELLQDSRINAAAVERFDERELKDRLAELNSALPQ